MIEPTRPGRVIAIRDRLRTRSEGLPAWLQGHALKVLDFNLGTAVNRLNLLLGDASLRDWWRDDWDDRPYEINAGCVYPEFVSHTLCLDITNVLVIEAYELVGPGTPEWSKDDLKSRQAPGLTLRFDLDRGVPVYLGDIIIVPARGPLPRIDIALQTAVERGWEQLTLVIGSDGAVVGEGAVGDTSEHFGTAVVSHDHVAGVIERSLQFAELRHRAGCGRRRVRRDRAIWAGVLRVGRRRRARVLP